MFLTKNTKRTALAAAASLSTLLTATAAQAAHSAVAHNILLAQSSSGSTAGHGSHGSSEGRGSMEGHGDMAGMEGHRMMMHHARPDGTPPAGMMGAHAPGEGQLMLSFGYMHMEMEGNRDGTRDVSRSEVLNDFMVTPTSMSMDMVMPMLMYGFTDDISAMVMLPLVRKEMDHVTRTGVKFTTKSKGIGDLRLGVIYKAFDQDGHTLYLEPALSVPSGSIDETDRTPMGPNTPLPYPMQLGSGTFDFVPTISYGGFSGDVSYGAQASATIRIGENERNYALGNVYKASVHGAYRWNDWVSSSVRIAGEITENIDGADPRLNPNVVPTADPDRRGGERIDVGVGLNLRVPTGPLEGLAFGVEGIIPVYQNLDGPQLERDYSIAFVVRKMF